MTNAERGLLIAVAEGLANLLLNVGGGEFAHHRHKLGLAVRAAREEAKMEYVDDGRGG